MTVTLVRLIGDDSYEESRILCEARFRIPPLESDVPTLPF